MEPISRKNLALTFYIYNIIISVKIALSYANFINTVSLRALKIALARW